ncbi:hypothetical protein [Nitratireductor sp. XY-223]|uniref:hypothetical protein n=1 Tax=Nitratireductor sp. XY-223 TaxID=2561926 RepID=UPI0010A9AF05|nr:hypothetical protein [Nitratireductor sp. XY-223]
MPGESVTTLADLQAEGWHCWAHCGARNCGSASKLDIGLLIERFGPGHSFINEARISSLLVCRRCGHQGGRLSICASGNAETR